MTGNQHGYQRPPKDTAGERDHRTLRLPSVSHNLTDERLIEVQSVRRRYKIPRGEEASEEYELMKMTFNLRCMKQTLRDRRLQRWDLSIIWREEILVVI